MIQNKFFSIKSRFFASCMALTFVALIFAASVNAQTTTFAQFQQVVASTDFVFTNSATPDFTFSTVGGGSAVKFTYSNISGLPAELQGDQLSHITVTGSGSTATASSFGGFNFQPFNQSITIAITRDSATSAGIGSGTRRNLLTAVFTPIAGNNPSMVGSNGGNSATLNASTPTHTVTFTSDFVSFTSTVNRNLGLSFSGATTAYTINANQFLNSFSAAGTGTFASDPAPLYLPPTASPITIAGRVLAPSGRGLSNTYVVMYDSEGNRRVSRSNVFGYFSFDEVEPVGIVTIEVSSKLYQYAPQSYSLTDSISDLEFRPMETAAKKSELLMKKF